MSTSVALSSFLAFHSFRSSHLQTSSYKFDSKTKRNKLQLLSCCSPIEIDIYAECTVTSEMSILLFIKIHLCMFTGHMFA